MMDAQAPGPERTIVSAAVLGLPALGLAFAITTVSALVPLTLQRLGASAALIGGVVAGEGLVALLLPLWIGPLSDRLHTPIGGRLPFVIAGAALCAASLTALPFAGSIALIAAILLVFFLGYFTCYPAYRALYPELVPARRFGRAQGTQSLLREIGLVLALTGSPLLFTWRAPAPFLAAAGALLAISAAFVLRLWRLVPRASRSASGHGRRRLPPPELARLLGANALFEFALAGLKSFIVLFVVVGTGRSPAAASGLMAIVAVVAVVAAPTAGWLGDRFGALRTTRLALYVYALGMLLPCFTQSLWVLIPAMPLVGFGGAVVMTLPYTLVAQTSDVSPGESAGWYEFSRGAGVVLGPLVTGAAIDLLRPVFPATRGYAALWLVQALALLASLALLPRGARPACAERATVTGRPGRSRT